MSETQDGPLDLTHLCLMELPVLIILKNPFRNEGLLGGKFQFYSNFKSTCCKQTVQNLIRRDTAEWRLIWFFTVWRCPIKSMLGLNGLK